MTHDISQSLVSLVHDAPATDADLTSLVDHLLDLVDDAISSKTPDAVTEAAKVVLGADAEESLGSRPATLNALVHGSAIQQGLARTDGASNDLAALAAGVLPAALEAGRSTGASGAQILRATAIGLETARRVRGLLDSSSTLRPWDRDGLVQGIGAANAAAALLGLDEQRTTYALAVASTQATGTSQAVGTGAKDVLTGLGAANGLEAALLAEQGIDGPVRPIEGRRGLLALMHPGANDTVADVYAKLLQKAGESTAAPGTSEVSSTEDPASLRERYSAQVRAILSA